MKAVFLEVLRLCAEAGVLKAGVVSPDGPELLVNTTKDWKRRKAMREGAPPRGRIPRGVTATERMECKLGTKRGAALYKKRAQTVESVFGQIKDTRRLDSFCRGNCSCEEETALIRG